MGPPLVEPGMGIGCIQFDGIVIRQDRIMEPFDGKQAESPDEPCIGNLGVCFNRP